MDARRGRPPGPSDATVERVMQAAFRLLVTEGPTELTPLRLHRETGVARTTIYRHWPTPEHLIEVIVGRATARVAVETTGDLAADLLAALSTVTERFAHRPLRELHGALAAPAGVADPAVPTPTARRYVAGLVAPVREVIAGACTAGTLEGDVDDLVAELCGPVFFTALLLGHPLRDDAARSAVTAFLSRPRRRAGGREPTQKLGRGGG